MILLILISNKIYDQHELKSCILNAELNAPVVVSDLIIAAGLPENAK